MRRHLAAQDYHGKPNVMLLRVMRMQRHRLGQASELNAGTNEPETNTVASGVISVAVASESRTYVLPFTVP